MILPEIVAVGIYSSQTIEKSTIVSKDRQTTMFEIELPMEDGGVSYIDGNTKPISPHMLICAKPGQTRHTKFPYRCYFLHMTLQGGSLQDVLTNAPDFLEPENTDVYKALFNRLIKHFNSGADHHILLQSIVLELIHNIRQDSFMPADRGNQNSNHHAMVRQAVAYVHNHLTEDLRLETVAKAVSLSTIHFHNTFQSVMGQTLREYVEEQRLKKAIHLLITTDCCLTEIAFACGFSSQSYFSYVFRRRMKQTPREYVQEFYSKYEI